MICFCYWSPLHRLKRYVDHWHCAHLVAEATGCEKLASFLCINTRAGLRHVEDVRPNSLRVCHFYRAMHFSAKRGIAIACRLSIRLSVRPSVCPSVTLVNCDHIGWNSSEIISPSVSLGRSLFATPTRRVCSKGNTPKFGPKVTHPC